MRIRRNPRAEREAAAVSGSPRARFDFGRRGSGGRLRRDPRQELATQSVRSGPRLRLDRSQRFLSGNPGANPVDRPEGPNRPEIVLVERPAFLVGVVPDAPGGRLSALDRQTIGAARLLAGRDGAVVVFAPPDCEPCGALGADRLLRLPECRAAHDPDAIVSAIHAAVQGLNPRHVLFPETVDGGDRARRLAVVSGESLFTDAELVSASSLLRAARGRRVEQRCAPARLITVAADAVAEYSGPPREAREIADGFPMANMPGDGGVITSQRIPADPATVPLGLADFVAAVGNGVTDLATFRRLAEALRATPGASRVMCDAGLMPRHSQVGASGTVLTATCYFALGISGAPQHLQGVAGCEHVVAVNTDLHAAMIERAGLAIVQDAQRVMPALLAALAQDNGGAA
ncbi:Electron transfer flavoprotein alpha subunit [Methylobacterium nodulans ORS 2060]|uniref:Electron transfer flavoprotein alpha subunit n=2 Tax=Methylobacterium nodulans TaxID=114616 RepID=B8IMD1_METNO|nr:Electron transfer flavoprotein alpha subunit [Methylobacterium nodulans ORS 2060]